MAPEGDDDFDDPAEGQGDESAYDGLAVKHLNSAEGRAEIAKQRPSKSDPEVTV